jgi:hypothetical protein
MNLEQVLTDTLQEQADRTSYRSGRYWDVVERAAAVRRHRRHRTLVAVAAVAVVVPLAVAAPTIRRAVDGGPATPDPTKVPAHHHRTFTPAPVPTFAEIPRGPKPDVPYLAGDTYVVPNGTSRTLPKGGGQGADWAVPLGASLLLYTEDTHPMGTVRLVEGDQVTDLGCGSYSFARNQDRTQVAYWISSRCTTYPTSGTLYVADTATGTSTRYATTGRSLGSVEPVAIIGGRVIAETGTRVKASSVVSIGPDGSVRRVPGLDYVFGFDPVHGWVVGEAPSGRHVMLDPVTGDVKWSTPGDGWTLNSVSPDGKYVLGIRSQPGSPTTRYALLDATTGHLVARIEPAGPPNFQITMSQIMSMAWDHDALLSNVIVADQDALLRSDASGHTTVATNPVHYHWPGGVEAPPSYYGLSGF